MILSFGLTSHSLAAGHKTVTRRTWKPRTIATYERLRESGETVQAWSAGPHRGGVHIADIRITEVSQSTWADAPDSDYEAEGFGWYDDWIDEFAPVGPNYPVWHRRRRFREKLLASLPTVYKKRDCLVELRFWWDQVRPKCTDPITVVRFDVIRLTEAGEKLKKEFGG